MRLPPIDDAERAVAQGRADESVRGVTEDGNDSGSSPSRPVVSTALVFAASTDSVQATLTYVGLVSLIIGLLGVAAAATAGYGVARAGLAPLRDLTEAAEHIADTTDLTPIADGR